MTTQGHKCKFCNQTAYGGDICDQCLSGNTNRKPTWLEVLHDSVWGIPSQYLGYESLIRLPEPEKLYSHELHIELVKANDELLEAYLTNPNLFDDISPQRFQDLVESIFRNQGFETKQIGAWNHKDGGVDILAVEKSLRAGDIRVAIQCKTVRSGSHKRKIDAKPIRELHGVLDRMNAHKGIVVTSAWFTDNAWQEVKRDFWKISLQDRDHLLKVLRSLLCIHEGD